MARGKMELVQPSALSKKKKEMGNRHIRVSAWGAGGCEQKKKPATSIFGGGPKTVCSGGGKNKDVGFKQAFSAPGKKENKGSIGIRWKKKGNNSVPRRVASLSSDWGGREKGKWICRLPRGGAEFVFGEEEGYNSESAAPRNTEEKGESANEEKGKKVLQTFEISGGSKGFFFCKILGLDHLYDDRATNLENRSKL